MECDCCGVGNNGGTQTAFTCQTFEQSFSIDERFLSKKEAAVCPNCDSHVSPELLESLKFLLKRIPETTTSRS